MKLKLIIFLTIAIVSSLGFAEEEPSIELRASVYIEGREHNQSTTTFDDKTYLYFADSSTDDRFWNRVQVEGSLEEPNLELIGAEWAEYSPQLIEKKENIWVYDIVSKGVPDRVCLKVVVEGREYQTEVGYLPSDYTSDGVVDLKDFTLFRNNFGMATDEKNAIMDSNGDGTIDFSDFITFRNNYGSKLPEGDPCGKR